MQSIQAVLAANLPYQANSISGTLSLLEEGASIPFISRYRKEATQGLDEVAIETIEREWKRLNEVIKRKEAITAAIEKQGKLAPDLRKAIEHTWDGTTLEDLYLPYKQKRKTRATIAREKGLEPLAKVLMQQYANDLELEADRFLSDDVDSTEDALAGARDIIAEWVNEHANARMRLRNLFQRDGLIYATLVKAKEEEAQKYRDYFDYSEPWQYAKGHRVLAILRGENEGFLRISIEPDEEKALGLLERIFVKGRTASSNQVKLAVADSYKRLLQPSLENELKSKAKELADEGAINVFAENLRQLLLQPPLGSKRVMAIDPGFRTGCKLVCLNELGDLLFNVAIYPHTSDREKAEAVKKVENYVKLYKVEAIAIGNGTAGRETFDFIKSINLSEAIQVFMVNEDGASVYSASQIARDEFPDHDVTVRGAVSIGRRLIDPLAELVKIEPKAIGVGQYQHDVDQKKLAESLNRVVESCVNSVGVNLNTASEHLLAHVSGIGPKLAHSIIDYRSENGSFISRNDLNAVSGLGPKAFEQCAGFLRIEGAANPLDNTAVHPERYKLVEQMARDLGVKVKELIKNEELVRSIVLRKYVNVKVGLPTLTDIKKELLKPGRDPRGKVETFSFSDEIKSIEDVKEGMILPGLVTNITNFGAFVNIGAKQDGLVHVSQLADKYVKDPNEVVKLNQQVLVKVVEVDLDRKRLSLSIKQASSK